MSSNGRWEPNITIFICTRRWPTAEDLCQLSHLAHPRNVRIIPLCGSDQIDPKFVLSAFANGADGVLIGTQDRQGGQQQQLDLVDLRHQFLKRALQRRRIDDRRLRIDVLSLSNRERLERLLSEMRQSLRELQSYSSAAKAE